MSCAERALWVTFTREQGAHTAAVVEVDWRVEAEQLALSFNLVVCDSVTSRSL